MVPGKRFIPTRKAVFIGVPLMLVLLFWLVSYVRRKPASSEPPSTTIEMSTPNNDQWVQAEEIVEPDDYPVNDIKVILFYVPFFGRADYYFGQGRKPFLKHGCRVNACEVTSDRQRMNESDAVIVHPFDVNWDKDPLPPRKRNRRTRRQRWILHISESPDNSHFDWKKLDGIFNWTTCYRNDCDIHHPYLRTSAIKKPEVVNSNTTTTTTTKPETRRLVSWLVSNCVTKGHREEYVDELKKHIQVDVYGRCGKPCAKPCNNVYAEYKFYLAFENTICKDYVTEKLLNPLKHRRTVPVVYGAADYRAIAPPNSVIDVRDFASPKHLADYLLMLDANDTLYERYFDWKADYEVKYVLPFCDLCAKLHAEAESDRTKVYDDLHEWFVTKANCRHDVIGMQPNDLTIV